MNTCRVCSQKGLLIYPVRYAIACPAGAAGVPGLSGNFKIENAPADIGKAKYTLRSMRPGYLYAFDEKRGRLSGYLVFEHGNLWNFDLDYLPPHPQSIQLGCVSPEEKAFSRCVDIVHVKGDEASNLWIGWTSVVWTKEQIALAGDAKWRRKHMQCINLNGMLAGSAAHTAEFAKSHKQIAHFSADAAAMVKAFSFSNTATDEECRQKDLGDFVGSVMAGHAPYNKGYIVALNDPVGITNDLSELTLPSAHAGFDEDVYRGKIIYDMLIATEERIRAEAREEVAQGEAIVVRAGRGGSLYRTSDHSPLWEKIKAGGATRYEAKMAAQNKKYGDDLAGRQKAAADLAWEDTSKDDHKLLIDETRRAAFPALYSAALEAYKPEYNALLDAHLAWLKSVQLANWMDGAHDRKDIRSGYAYSESMTQCIGKAVSGEPCSAQLLTWLNSGDLQDTRNLYARALLFNQDELIDAAAPHLKGSDVQYENVLNIYKRTLVKLDKRQAKNLMDRLALATANVLVKALKNSTWSVMRSVTLLHLSIIGQVTIRNSELRPSQLATWILAQAKENNTNLEPAKPVDQKAALGEARAAIKRGGPGSGVVAYEFNVVQLENEQLINAGTLRDIKIPGFDTAKKWLGSSTPRVFHIGVVTAIVQLVALTFMAEDLANNDSTNDLETRTKVGAGVVCFGAALMDTVFQTVSKSEVHPLAVFIKSQWAIDAKRALRYAKNARVVGAAAGCVAACYDLFVTAPSEWHEKHRLGAILYGANGVLGVAIAIAACIESMIFVPLLVLSIVIGIAIALFNSGALQKWVSRCYFSLGVSGVRAATNGKPPFHQYPYPTLSEELKAYNSAVGA